MADLKLALRITAENGQLKAELLNSSQLVRRFGTESKVAGSLATGEFTKARRAVASIKEAILDARRAMIAYAAVQGSIEIGKSFIDARVELQRFQFTLENVFGSTEAAAEQMAFLRATSERLGLSLQDAASGYVRLSASAISAGISTQQLQQGFIGLADASTVLHLSGADLQGILIQLEQGMSLGRVQMQDLRAVAQHMPAVFDLVNEAFKGTGMSMQQMLASGGIPAEQFFLRFTKILREKYGPESAKAAQSLNASLNRVKTAWFEFRNNVLNDQKAGDLAGILNGIAHHLPGLADAFSRAAEVGAAFAALKIAEKVGGWTRALIANIAAENAQAVATLKTANATVESTAAVADNAAMRVRAARAAMAEASGIARLRIAEAELIPALQAEAVATAEVTAARERLAIARGGFGGFIASVRKSRRELGLLATAGHVAGKALGAAAQLAFAGWMGWQIGSYLRDQFAIVRRAGDLAVEGLLIGATKVKQYWEQAAVAVSDAFTLHFGRIKSDIDSIGKRYAAQIAQIKGNFPSGEDDAKSAAAKKQKEDAAKQFLKNLAKLAAEAQKQLTAATANVAGLKAQQTMLKDALARKKATLDDALKNNRISYADYYAALAAMQQQSLNQQIALQQAKLAQASAKLDKDKYAKRPTSGENPVTKDEAKRTQLLAQLTVLRRKLGDVAVTQARKTADAETKLNNTMDGVREKLLAITDPIKAARQKVVDQYKTLIAQLKAAGRSADLKLVVKLELASENKAAVDAIKKQATSIKSRVREQIQTLANQVKIGTITPGQARTAQAGDQQAAATQLDALIAKAQTLDTVAGGKLVSDLQRMRAGIVSLREPVNQLVTDVAGAGQTAFAQFFDSVLSGTASVKDALLDFVNSFARSLQQIASQMLAQQTMKQLMGAVGYKTGTSGQVTQAKGGFAASALGSIVHGIGGALGVGGKTVKDADGLAKLSMGSNGLLGAQSSAGMAGLLDKVGDGLKSLFAGGKSIVSDVGGALKSLFSGSGASSLLSTLGGALKSLFSAISGAFSGGGGSGVGSAIGAGVSAIVSFFAGGGAVNGAGGPTSDSIPAMLSNGEYVLNARTVQRVGVRMLDALNGGTMPRAHHFANGGQVGGASNVTQLRASGGVTVSAPISVQVGSDSNDDDAPARGRLVAQGLRAAIQVEVLRMQRPGGPLHLQTITTFGGG